MEKHRQQWRRFCNRLMAGLLALLGFAGCTDPMDDDNGPIICEYGTPSAKYNVKGKVLDADTQKPVAGIRVVSGVLYPSEGKYRLSYYPDTLYTDAQGEFETVRGDFPTDKYRFIWEEVDGDTYKKDSIDVGVGKFSGASGHWYEGEADISVTLNIEKEGSE